MAWHPEGVREMHVLGFERISYQESCKQVMKNGRKLCPSPTNQKESRSAAPPDLWPLNPALPPFQPDGLYLLPQSADPYFCEISKEHLIFHSTVWTFMKDTTDKTCFFPQALHGQFWDFVSIQCLLLDLWIENNKCLVVSFFSTSAALAYSKLYSFVLT